LINQKIDKFETKWSIVGCWCRRMSVALHHTVY